MDKIIAVIIFSIMLVTFVADPAPVSIEAADLVLIALPCLVGLLSGAVVKSCKIHLQESNLLIAILLYLSYLLISLLIGLTNGTPILNILRSLGPYINFFPLIMLGFLPARLLNPWMICSIFLFVGSLQAGYQMYLYLTHSHANVGTIDVLRSRITLIEPRTTLPIVLSISILPLALLSYKNIGFKLIALCLILFGLIAGAATLTRSTIISIIVGWLTFLFLFLYKQSYLTSFSFTDMFKRYFKYFILFTAIIILISMIPKINMLEHGLLERFTYHSSLTTSTDYTNGRLYDEWIPAFHAWVNSGILSIFFGIGAGSSFTVATGEERTYIHNLIIYSLVYGGIYGLFACVWLYFTVFKTLVMRAFQSDQNIYLGFAALLASIFCYAQLFAVHKGLAFNAMLFLIITLALVRPARAS